MKTLAKFIFALLSIIFISCSKDEEIIEPVQNDIINVSMNVFAKDTANIVFAGQEHEVIQMKMIKGTVKIGETLSVRIDNINVKERTLVSIYLNNENVEKIYVYPSTMSFIFTKDITKEYLKQRLVKF